MKAASKVFIWLGMICFFYLVFPIVVGAIALKKINKAKTKSDLQTIGVLTLLFCSMLGGIFLLCIEDDELSKVDNFKAVYNNEDNVRKITDSDSEEVVKCETKILDKRQVVQSNKRVRLINITLVYALLCLTILSFIFSLIPLFLYENGNSRDVLCLAFVSVILINVICLILTSIIKKYNYNILSYILISLIFILSILVIIYSYLAWDGAGIYTSIYNELYNYYENTIIGVNPWCYWVVFTCGCLITLISGFEMIFNIVVGGKMKSQKTTKEKVVIGNLQIELNEVKRLFYNKIISEEEYNQIRERIILKYYK